MKTDCHCDSPVDGSSQRGRYLAALDPAYAPIDGRSLEDLLVFAKRYAAQIRFYDIPESMAEPPAPPAQPQTQGPKGVAPQAAPAYPSWREFFRRDLAVIAASIAVVDTAQIRKDYDELRAALEARPTRGALSALFDPILGMARRIDRWYAIAIAENPLRGDLDLAIASTLRAQVAAARAYEAGYKYEDPAHPLDLDYTALDHKLWGLDQAVEADKTIFQGADAEDRIRSAALFVDDIFHAFYAFMTDMVGVKSVGYMKFALEQYPAHQPHMALFIAFLELFQLAQAQMNGITERMLDFYYRDVLHLTPKPAIPDRVHLVFQLAQGVVEYDVTAGTALKGGKDAGGKDLVYRTVDELVVNQAKVVELKNIQIVTQPRPAGAETAFDAVFARPIANSLDGLGAKITDPSGKWPTFGRGGVIDTLMGVPVEKGLTLCERIANLGGNTERVDEPKRIGFALASPQLMLQGGNRLIAWVVKGLADLVGPAGEQGNLEVWLTGKKGWFKLGYSNLEAFGDKTGSFRRGIFPTGVQPGCEVRQDVNADDTLVIYLSEAQDAVVPFDPAVHTDYYYPTRQPVLQVLLDPLRSLPATGWPRSDIQLVFVQVGSINRDSGDNDPPLHFDGLKTLVVENETGPVDAGKPFDPFTQYPQYGKSFYVGSAEVFNKRVADLAVDIKHDRDPEDADLKVASEARTERFSASALVGRQWRRLLHRNGNPADDWSRSDLSKDMLHEIVDDAFVALVLPRDPIEPVLELADSSKGFVRLTLLPPAGEHPALNLERSQQLATILKIKELSVSYVSALFEFERGIEQFFHVYPFGVAEATWRTSMHPITSPPPAVVPMVDAKGSLLPQFTYLSPNAAYRLAFTGMQKARPLIAKFGAPPPKSPCETFIEALVDQAEASAPGSATDNQYSGNEQEEGLLYIGIEGLRPLDTLSLLFEFAEGSAIDEDNDPPEIHWSYLVNNEWRPLKGENLISDGTYGFQTTGIVRIDVPEDCNDLHTIVTTGLRWFAASVTEHSDRIPMLIDVVAQAAEVRLDDQGNDPSHFDTALPAGSISKLAVAVAEIDRVEQPFASFDGKHAEVGREFYARVSERLRHKARAVTPWDYEHLVLDRFPSIYKVKCIQHTDPNCLCRQPPDFVACCGPQVAPGHVLVIPIANLKHRNAANPLQPKTSRRTLLEIEDYLRQRSSPFVRVHARNPVYEQILVFFQVQFMPGTNKGYHLKKLNDEIVHFLTPWAFDEQADVTFAQKVYASAIINFVEERPYVDFITDFLMFVCRNECCPKPVGEGDARAWLSDAVARMTGCCDSELFFGPDSGHFLCEVVAQPSTPRSLLVSAPRHIIIPYEAPTRPSPCEQRLAGAGSGSGSGHGEPGGFGPPVAPPAPPPTVTPAPPTVTPAPPTVTPAPPHPPVKTIARKRSRAAPRGRKTPRGTSEPD